MIVAISASSPVVSVALLDAEGKVVASARELAPRNSSGVALSLLGQVLEIHRPEIVAYAADTGPGSFIGARVGVSLAKTLAYAGGAGCYGCPSFDLISTDRPVAIPNRKHEWLLREPGQEPRRTSDLPEGVLGYGDTFEFPTYPDASAFGPLMARLALVSPQELLPTYVVEPSISQPKAPYREGAR